MTRMLACLRAISADTSQAIRAWWCRICREPGAGSLRAANYIYSVAPKDGTAFGLFARDMVLVALLGGDPNVQFDPRKFT
jgi:hypothetical protein